MASASPFNFDNIMPGLDFLKQFAAAGGAQPSFTDNQTFWVGGIGQENSVDGAKACGDASKVARVETMQTAGNIGLTILTLGSYAPRQLAITCTP